LDLIGTVVLPAALLLTVYLIFASMVTHIDSRPLLMLLATLGLPGLSIIFITGKPSYIMWMLIYFCSLPVWNFVLPLYAFWKFDDFSWGETRRVDGDDVEHGVVDGEYHVGSVVLK
jgi:chitin synthase